MNINIIFIIIVIFIMGNVKSFPIKYSSLKSHKNTFSYIKIKSKQDIENESEAPKKKESFDERIIALQKEFEDKKIAMKKEFEDKKIAYLKIVRSKQRSYYIYSMIYVVMLIIIFISALRLWYSILEIITTFNSSINELKESISQLDKALRILNRSILVNAIISSFTNFGPFLCKLLWR